MNTTGMEALCMSPISSPALSIQQVCPLLATAQKHFVNSKATARRSQWVSVKAKRHTPHTHCNQCFQWEVRWGVHFERNVSIPGEDDIEDEARHPGRVCFRSGWDISSSANVTLTAPPQPQNTNGTTYCLEPDSNQICTTLFVSFSSGNCSTPILRTRNITASGMSFFFFFPVLIVTHSLHRPLCGRHLVRR